MCRSVSPTGGMGSGWGIISKISKPQAAQIFQKNVVEKPSIIHSSFSLSTDAFFEFLFVWIIPTDHKPKNEREADEINDHHHKD